MRRRFRVFLATAAAVASVVCISAAGLAWADRAFPPPLDHSAGLSRQVTGEGGALLRAYAAPDGRWRLPVELSAVDPDFIAMLIAYEDRRFRRHHGVDPLAVLRAGWQFVSHGGRIVSGGSTLTMQLARLIEPRDERSVTAKLRQMARALQIERRLTKDEILARYLSYAPYGGNIEGVRAASLSWFGREPRKLTLSQSALLVALPQLPEARRPDRHPGEARIARDRVLRRMHEAGLLPQSEVGRAALAAVPHRRQTMPDLAAHLADEAVRTRPMDQEIRLTIHAEVQRNLEKVAAEAAGWLGPRQSVALVMADAHSGEIIASVGSTGFLDDQRFGAIDMTRAIRSPGSALKPFIYGLALEDAVVAPETLIDDTPANFSGYRPRNFDLSYQGEVTVRDALQRSLNVPAVRLLQAVAPERLLARLRRGGVRLDLPDGGAPGLAIGLGGAGLTLRQLVQLYTIFPNNGAATVLSDGIDPRPPAPLDAPVLSPVANWETLDILAGVPAPQEAARLAIAYKTGTSYGYRDAWAIGFDGRHVLGVWVGRADATPVPGMAGVSTAAPLLFDAFARSGVELAALPRRLAGIRARSRADLPFALRKFRPDGAMGEGPLMASAPEIVFPPDGARVDLGAAAGAGTAQPLALKLQGGTAPYRWIVNGRPLPDTTRRRNISWSPDGAGTSNLTVIDARGRAASVSVVIE
ncbi:penicillin-binding protein 1C [Hoeflea marina]|uniref:peptidoglycan glycosyltransferase n=1 Tax=Hoeflea marina TaxID=274592 RepID=A0A317PUZ1_9HYPH|nr:penicillin-binding protein 1C [Hoeflea marina]PWW04076.1 penicillin-binding protein 1C [Hoeflea marina]